jgi:phosphatidylinositol glycan class F
MAPAKATPKAASAAAATSVAPYTPPSGAQTQPTTQAIAINASPISQTFRHLHPLLVLGLFAARFGALVADPVPALARTLAPLAAAQAAYCVICLPPVASSTDPADAAAPKKKPARKAAKDLGLAGRISVRVPSEPFCSYHLTTPPAQTALLALTLSAVAGAPVLFAAAVLLGAPLTTHGAHTGLLAAHAALLALPPLFYTRGVSARAWREVAGALLPFDETWGGAVGVVVGAWLGAVPIPLDWDREWQRWPVTVVAGAYRGWGLGRGLGEWVFRGKRVRMDVE